jgi:putative endonuclease
VNAALMREKQLKKWNRQWKINLIEKDNPDWLDMFDKIYRSVSQWIPAFAGMTRL